MRLSSHQRELIRNKGRSHYEAKQYREALDQFTKLIDDEPSITALDFRAAVHEKLGNLDAALQDSVAMMKLEPCIDRGYLRGGTVLQKMHKTEKAIKVYETGLKRCKASGAAALALESAYKTIKDSIPDTRAVDFINSQTLPAEILEMIIRLLPFRDLCRCLQVSKSWSSTIKANDYFWRDIDFSTSKRPVSVKCVSTYTKLAQGHAKRLVLHRVALQGNKALLHALRSCPKLESLHILSGGMLNQTLTDAVRLTKHIKSVITGEQVIIPLSAIVLILSRCATLEQARFPSVYSDHKSEVFEANTGTTLQCNVLRDLEIRINTGDFGRPKANFLPDAPNLRRFRFMPAFYARQDGAASFALDRDIFRAYPKLEELDLECISLGALEEGGLCLPSLKRLALNECSWTNSTDFPAEFDCTLSGLERFTYQMKSPQPTPHTIPFAPIIKMLGTARRVQKIFISVDYTAQPEDITELFGLPSLSELRDVELRLPSGGRLESAAVDGMCKLGRLQAVSLPQSAVTGVHVRSLVSSCPALGYLNLTDCRDVSDDAVRWVRDQGLILKFSLAT